ncbi:hypothetical protein Scep_007840 [Stephania cephalantha]|uniref:Uncharacterized protein n=1 Tax=Stephania cephalantha TaxID=152367 RepID=A0AAP0KAL3_9MAGN
MYSIWYICCVVLYIRYRGFVAMESATTFQTGFRNDREDAVRDLRVLMSCIHRTTSNCREIFRLLRAQVTPSSSSSIALVIKAERVFIVHNPPETFPVQVGPAVTEVTHVRAEIVPSIPETPAEDTPSTPIDTGVRATAEARQTHEFRRHHPEKFHVGTNLEAAEEYMRSHEKIHDVLAIPAQMQPSISSSLLVSEVDVWWRTTRRRWGTVRNLKRTEFQTTR